MKVQTCTSCGGAARILVIELCDPCLAEVRKGYRRVQGKDD